MEKYRRKVTGKIKSTYQETNVTRYSKTMRKTNSRMYFIVDNTRFPDGGAYGTKQVKVRASLKKSR